MAIHFSIFTGIIGHNRVNKARGCRKMLLLYTPYSTSISHFGYRKEQKAMVSSLLRYRENRKKTAYGVDKKRNR